jgi:hypothetical protein
LIQYRRSTIVNLVISMETIIHYQNHTSKWNSYLKKDRMTHSAQHERMTLASYTINYNLGWWLTGYSLLFFQNNIQSTNSFTWKKPAKTMSRKVIRARAGCNNTVDWLARFLVLLSFVVEYIIILLYVWNYKIFESFNMLFYLSLLSANGIVRMRWEKTENWLYCYQ